jgi:hypothetical protein
LRLNANCALAVFALEALSTLERRLRLNANCALAVFALDVLSTLGRQLRLNANGALAVFALDVLSKRLSRSFGGKSSCKCDLALGPLHSLKRRIRKLSGGSIKHRYR